MLLREMMTARIQDISGDATLLERDMLEPSVAATRAECDCSELSSASSERRDKGRDAMRNNALRFR